MNQENKSEFKLTDEAFMSMCKRIGPTRAVQVASKYDICPLKMRVLIVESGRSYAAANYALSKWGYNYKQLKLRKQVAEQAAAMINNNTIDSASTALVNVAYKPSETTADAAPKRQGFFARLLSLIGGAR